MVKLQYVLLVFLVATYVSPSFSASGHNRKHHVKSHKAQRQSQTANYNLIKCNRTCSGVTTTTISTTSGVSSSTESITTGAPVTVTSTTAAPVTEVSSTTQSVTTGAPVTVTSTAAPTTAAPVSDTTTPTVISTTPTVVDTTTTIANTPTSTSANIDTTTPISISTDAPTTTTTTAPITTTTQVVTTGSVVSETTTASTGVSPQSSCTCVNPAYSKRLSIFVAAVQNIAVNAHYTLVNGLTRALAGSIGTDATAAAISTILGFTQGDLNAAIKSLTDQLVALGTTTAVTPTLNAFLSGSASVSFSGLLASGNTQMSSSFNSAGVAQFFAAIFLNARTTVTGESASDVAIVLEGNKQGSGEKYIYLSGVFDAVVAGTFTGTLRADVAADIRVGALFNYSSSGSSGTGGTGVIGGTGVTTGTGGTGVTTGTGGTGVSTGTGGTGVSTGTGGTGGTGVSTGTGGTGVSTGTGGTGGTSGITSGSGGTATSGGGSGGFGTGGGVSGGFGTGGATFGTATRKHGNARNHKTVKHHHSNKHAKSHKAH